MRDSIAVATTTTTTTTTACGGPWTYASACSEASMLNISVLCSVCRAWASLDAAVAASGNQRPPRPTTRALISGGIFLYEKQAATMANLVRSLGEVIARTGSATVCETGFNAGHSALLFLSVSPHVRVVSFDTFSRPYQRRALQHLRSHLLAHENSSSRLTIVPGDSRLSVPRFAVTHPRMRCDFSHASVPGREHDDLLNLRAVSRRGALIMPTAHTGDGAVYGEAGGAWRLAQRDLLIRLSTCGAAMRPRPVDTFVFTRGSSKRAGRALLSTSSSSTAAPSIGHIYCYGRYAARPPLHSGFVLSELADRILARSIVRSSVVLLANPMARALLAQKAEAEGHEVLASSEVRLLVPKLLSTVRWALLLFIDLGGEGREAAAVEGLLPFLAASTVTYIVLRFDVHAARVLLSLRYRVRLLSCTYAWIDFKPNALLDEYWVSVLDRRLRSRASSYAYVFATQGLDLAIPSRLPWMDLRSTSMQDVISGYEPMHAGMRTCAQRFWWASPKHASMARPQLHWAAASPPLPAGNDGTPQTTANRNRSRVYRTITPYGSNYHPIDGTRGAHPVCVTIGAPQPHHTTATVRANESQPIWHSHSDPSLAEAACARLRCGDAQAAGLPIPPWVANEHAPFQPVCTTRILPNATLIAQQRNSRQKRRRQQVAREPAAREPAAREPRPNLLFLLIDPLSRAELIRMLPEVRSLLRKSGFTSFQHYTAVGNNSGPNQVAMYLGETLGHRPVSSLRDKAWLWDALREMGYATLKAEDGCVLNSNMVASIRPRTTHGEQLEQLFCYDFGPPNCLGDRRVLAADVLLDYGRDFINTYRDAATPWAAFLSFTDSHEDSHTASGLLDKPLRRFLSGDDSSDDEARLRLGDRLGAALQRDTVIILASDHGLHYGPFFTTDAGRRERALPVLEIHLPTLLTDRGITIPSTNRLERVTAYDIHQTLTELFSIRERPTARSIDAKLGGQDQPHFGTSLLRALPERDCAAMGVPPSLCFETVARGRAGSAAAAAKPVECIPLPRTPSVLSFYADIEPTPPPVIQLPPSWPQSTLIPISDTISLVWMPRERLRRHSCRCATQVQPWHACRELSSPTIRHVTPTTRPLVRVLKLGRDDDFAVVHCSPHGASLKVAAQAPVQVHHRLIARRAVQPAPTQTVHEYATAVEESIARSLRRGSSPNVLIIQIDSLSRDAALRHLPLTNELLASHPTLLSANTAEISSADGDRRGGHDPPASGPPSSASSHRYVDVELMNHGVIGSNSIPNQAALLSGCVGVRTDARTMPPIQGMRFVATDAKREYRLLCAKEDSPAETRPSWHPREARSSQSSAQTAARSPWLFDIAKAQGYATFFAEEICTKGSPWAVDALINASGSGDGIDHEFHSLYCRLAEENGRGKKGSLPYISGAHKYGHYRWPFEQLQQMWRAYKGTPKFGYLSVNAVHDGQYGHGVSADLSTHTEGLSSVDEILSEYLGSLLHKKSADAAVGEEEEDTLIVLNGDHGAQDGPRSLDIGAQFEHRMPWARLLIPRALVSNATRLSANARRLSTPFDVYETLRKAMTMQRGAPPPGASRQSDDPPAPRLPWRVDMLGEEIDRTRSCREARIPAVFCPCQNQLMVVGPYVWASYEPRFNIHKGDQQLKPPMGWLPSRKTKRVGRKIAITTTRNITQSSSARIRMLNAAMKERDVG